MKNITKIGLLIAVVLAGAGAWSELKAVTPTTLVSKEIDFNTADFNTFAFMSENGDGTAFVLLNSLLDDGTIAAAFSFAATPYSISNNLQPGQSGNGIFSGSGHFSMAGVIFDPVTQMETPAVISVTFTVTNADNVSAYLQQSVSPLTNPVTGENMIVRQHSIGNQAYGFTAGSISISADGVVVKEAAGEWGNVSTYRAHLVQRVR